MVGGRADGRGVARGVLVAGGLGLGLSAGVSEGVGESVADGVAGAPAAESAAVGDEVGLCATRSTVNEGGAGNPPEATSAQLTGAPMRTVSTSAMTATRGAVSCRSRKRRAPATSGSASSGKLSPGPGRLSGGSGGIMPAHLQGEGAPVRGPGRAAFR